MYPRNFLGVVVQKDNVKTPWFNLDCHLINESKKTGFIQHLEASVTPAGKRGIQFIWNLFYKYLPGDQVMVKTADAAAMELGLEASRMIGTQFVGPHLAWEFQWPVGEYEFDILGWVNREPRGPEANLRTRFKVEISPQESQWLDYWAEAPESAWQRLQDPNHA